MVVCTGTPGVNVTEGETMGANAVLVVVRLGDIEGVCESTAAGVLVAVTGLAGVGVLGRVMCAGTGAANTWQAGIRTGSMADSSNSIACANELCCLCMFEWL